jgi:hypothetical protein
MLMHNGSMLLTIATAPQQKAALAQGGFFAFAFCVFPFSLS